jgi:hypothetical protein
MPDIAMIKALINGHQVMVGGRVAWTVAALLAAGEVACTNLGHPAPRWSYYVHGLRELGLVIDTLREDHSGAYPGYHARYVLRSKVYVAETLGTEP